MRREIEDNSLRGTHVGRGNRTQRCSITRVEPMFRRCSDLP